MGLSRFARPGLIPAALIALFSLASCKDSTSGTASGGGGEASPAPAESASPSAGAFDQPRKAEGAVMVRVITNNASPFWSAAEKGMEAGVRECPQAEAKRLTPGGASPTHADQKKTFEDAVASDPDGIAVTPIEAEAFAPVIDSALEKGIPVICFDSDCEKSKRLAYLGTNNYEAGKKAGEAALKLLPAGGKFVAFVGNMSAQNARDRFQGFVDATKGKIEMLQAPFEDQADSNKAISNAKDAISKYGDKINGFLGIWAYNGPGIIKAVEAAGIRDKVKIVCFDGDPQTLAGLQARKVDAAVIQKPYEFGRLSTRLLYLINRKGFQAAIDELRPELEKAGMKVEGNKIDTGVDVITPENIAPFMEKLKKLGLETT